MRKIIIILLLLTMVQLTTAAAPDPSAAREAAIIESIQAENEQTRQHINEFGEDTHQMYLQERDNIKKEINAILIKFKFTLAIVVFCAVLAALEMHDLLRRRRMKKYYSPTIESAEKMQEKMKT